MVHITHTETATRGVLCKKAFLKISLNSQENTCARVSFLIKFLALLKRRLWHRCFPVNLVKFLRTLFLTEPLWWLLLYTGSTFIDFYFTTDINLKP